MNRRQRLIERMDQLQVQGLDCQGCQGVCCTYEANSMMVTPLEAIELVEFLKLNDLFNDHLRQKCTETVSKFRLDQQLGNGKKSFLRRTYTCPFFNGHELGCQLPREVKPYGCLAFNAHHKEIKAREYCYSEIELLKKRDEDFSDESTKNEELKQRYSLSWDKTPLPVAILDFFKTSDL